MQVDIDVSLRARFDSCLATLDTRRGVFNKDFDVYVLREEW